jgi:hypothetical protein
MIVQSIPSYIAMKFHRLFSIGAEMCSHCARSVAKVQISCKYGANFGAMPDASIGHYTLPTSTPSDLIVPSNESVSIFCLWLDALMRGLLPKMTPPSMAVMIVFQFRLHDRHEL